MIETELGIYVSGKDSFDVLKEESFLQEMAEKVEPFLEQRRKLTYLTREDGQKLYVEWYPNLPDQKKGTVFVSHGFVEFTEKYREVFYYMLQQGYHVCAIEHRGHANSERIDGKEPAKTPAYIDKFQDYVDDLDAVVNEVLQKELPGPYYIYGHSMGGCIAALYLEQHPGVFDKAVLNAPMLEVNRGGIPKFVVNIITKTAEIIGIDRAFMLTQKAFSAKENFAHSAGTSYPRYMFYFQKQLANKKYQMAGASFRWTRESVNAGDEAICSENCKKVTIPVLLFQAEHDTFVSPGGQKTFISRISDGTLVKVPGSKHEIFLSENKILEKYWRAVFDFIR